MPMFTHSVGLLSYTFLCDTTQQDVIVPTLDYEERGDWEYCIGTITRWSPYQSEESIRNQFKKIKDQESDPQGWWRTCAYGGKISWCKTILSVPKFSKDVCNSTPWIFNASEHIDVQRFNVYHKNWLIKNLEFIRQPRTRDNNCQKVGYQGPSATTACTIRKRKMMHSNLRLGLLFFNIYVESYVAATLTVPSPFNLDETWLLEDKRGEIQ
ncbi:hypothetical protein SELMODRAFT_430703 [Selaginella moellendorffii]|uniref:Uncharacterized protein n=1 Tax=Selaginella moellendorffii TaxID=88036 RepID=D8TA81_SELML|nr:hypothetical protein SELMODRAFT_430703 [Selaginella moellendorffii]